MYFERNFYDKDLVPKTELLIIDQGRRNGFEHAGDSKTPVTFEQFAGQTSNLQFLKWQAKSQNMVGTSPHMYIPAGLQTLKLQSCHIPLLQNLNQIIVYISVYYSATY